MFHQLDGLQMLISNCRISHAIGSASARGTLLAGFKTIADPGFSENIARSTLFRLQFLA